MRTISDHIERVKAKPHHVRERVTFGIAGLITALIGTIWLGVSLTSGAFAIAGNGFAQATGAAPFTVDGQSASSDTSGLAGAAGALPATPTADANAPAHIDVVEDDTSAAPKGAASANQTIIPF